MPTDLEIAYRCAPVIVQKVNRDNPRGDFITRIDFTAEGKLESLTGNWGAVNGTDPPAHTKKEWKAVIKKDPIPFKYKLLPHVYYSVVETHTHYLIMYAIYHPQDWESPDTPWSHLGPRWTITEHAKTVAGPSRGRVGDYKPLVVLRVRELETYG
jgi:hypothetical protein